MNKIQIKAFENCLPEKIVTNDDLSKLVDTSDEWISSRTGIRQRRISDGITTSQLCIGAGKKLLEKTGTAPEEIDLIIVATISPDYLTPSTACLVQQALGCTGAVAFDINAACSGFVFALSTADKFLRSGSCKKALVFGGEIMSKLLDWSDRSTCVLFGDGAGGVLMTAEGEGESCIIAEDMHSEGSLAIKGGQLPVSNFVSESENDYIKALEMDGRAVFNFATRNVPKSVQAVLDKTGLGIDDIKYIVAHQANIRIIEVVAKKLKADMSKFYIDIDKTGNTSAGSIPIALGEMSEKGLLEKGDKIILTGFGSGLTWGTLLVEI